MRRDDFSSKSKIPPKVGGTGLHVLQGLLDLIELFSFHSLPF
ncbi:MAG: hypothetical protein RLZZ290_432 [Pseudomonadota bacterium]|jgi:hypothetical protein